MRSTGLQGAAGLGVGGKGCAVEGRFTAPVVGTHDGGWGDGCRVFSCSLERVSRRRAAYKPV